jgi:hypothetical protein
MATRAPCDHRKLLLEWRDYLGLQSKGGPSSYTGTASSSFNPRSGGMAEEKSSLPRSAEGPDVPLTAGSASSSSSGVSSFLSSVMKRAETALNKKGEDPAGTGGITRGKWPAVARRPSPVF